MKGTSRQTITPLRRRALRIARCVTPLNFYQPSWRIGSVVREGLDSEDSVRSAGDRIRRSDATYGMVMDEASDQAESGTAVPSILQSQISGDRSRRAKEIEGEDAGLDKLPQQLLLHCRHPPLHCRAV